MLSFSQSAQLLSSVSEIYMLLSSLVSSVGLLLSSLIS